MGYFIPTSYELACVQALIDTEAVRTVIPMRIAKELGLRIRSQQLAKYIDGRTRNSWINRTCAYRNTR